MDSLRNYHTHSSITLDEQVLEAPRICQHLNGTTCCPIMAGLQTMYASQIQPQIARASCDSEVVNAMSRQRLKLRCARQVNRHLAFARHNGPKRGAANGNIQAGSATIIGPIACPETGREDVARRKQPAKGKGSHVDVCRHMSSYHIRSCGTHGRDMAR